MKVLVAMSGGVDSSAAAALLLGAGHDVVGVTMKLWGGSQDSGCCSVGDVEDARRVAQQLGVAHHVFNFTDEFEEHVVTPYVADHAAGRTPNPCVECNRHLKFDRLFRRADDLGFDAVATGHHARVRAGRLFRGADRAKDQSYVLHMLTRPALDRLLLPVGDLTKDRVREIAAGAGLRTATKPDSQDTCFITASGGREAFLGARIALRPGVVVDRTGARIGEVPAVELLTVGQRKGLPGGAGEARYVVSTDAHAGVVTVGTAADLVTDRIVVGAMSWTGDPPRPGTAVMVQTSAHGVAADGTWNGVGVVLAVPSRRPAPGQFVVVYDGDEVLGGGPAT